MKDFVVSPQDPAWAQVDASKACRVLQIKGATGQLLGRMSYRWPSGKGTERANAVTRGLVISGRMGDMRLK